MSNREIILKFINDNLEWGDVKLVSQRLGVRYDLVSAVKRGAPTGRSKRVLKALEERAMENYKHAQQIAEYSNKKLSI